MKKTTKRAEMREILERWKSSGLSLRAFGKSEGIAYAKLLYWKKRLTDEPTFSQVQIVEPEPKLHGSCAEVISIWLANGVSLEVPSTVRESDLVHCFDTIQPPM